MPLPSPPRRETVGLLVRIAALAVVYIITGKLGLRVGAVGGFATLVWRPAGISLAALLLFGPRVWPGVAIGALVVNLGAGAPLRVALGVTLGNTLEPVYGAYALRHVPGFRPALDRVTDVMALVVLAAGVSTLLSATIGTISLTLGGLVPLAGVGRLWATWWLGDGVRVMVVAPLILTWAKGGRVHLSPRRWLEVGALVIFVVALALLVFTTPESRGFWLTYMIAPPLAWAALRFGPRGAATAIAIVAAIAITCTTLGTGPFTGAPSLPENLFFLNTFIAVLAVTFLALSAAMEERLHALKAKLIAEKAEHEALAADRAKSDFVAVMSHELRTPLTAIIGYAGLLRDEITGPLDDKQKEQLARIQRTGEHLTALIDQILIFSRLESGQEKVTKERVDVTEVVREVAAMAEPLVEQKGLRFSCEYPPVQVFAFTDSGKLRQILLNLISNAAKFTNAGEVRLSGEVDDGRFNLCVSDTGIGIEAANLERIFEPFWQVDQGLTRKAGGTGLGLNVSRRLARAMGGELRVESTPGKGSTFTLTCPLTNGGSAGPANDSANHRGTEV